MFRTARAAVALLVLLPIAGSSAALQQPTAHWPGSYVDDTAGFRGPVAYGDASLRMVFYVESDGRHLSAISFDGKVLWTRNPFVDAKLEPYRVAKPRIVAIGPASARHTEGRKGMFIAILFNSSQFGIVDVKSGDFTFLGQD